MSLITATLYTPGQALQQVDPVGLSVEFPSTQSSVERAAQLLGCVCPLIDVLVTGKDYVVYSVFDFEGGPVNTLAMQVINSLDEMIPATPSSHDDVLLGPVLVVRIDHPADAHDGNLD